MMKTRVCSQVVKETGARLMVLGQLFGLLFSREETDNNGSKSPPSLPETLPLPPVGRIRQTFRRSPCEILLWP